MAKYALMNGDIVDTISYVPQEGFVEVADTVFADMVRDGDGNFDYSDEKKAVDNDANQAIQDRITDRASGKAKLEALGLSSSEVDALTK